VGTFGGLVERLAEVGIVTSAVVLAAQAFLALIPLLMAIVALAPPGVAEVMVGQLRQRFGLTGGTDEMIVDLSGQRDQLRSTITVLSAVVVLLSATAFTRALQRVYEAAWGLPRVGLRGSVRGLVWLGGLVLYLTVIGLGLRLAGGGFSGTLLRGALLVAGALLLWWWTPFLLLLGRVQPRALLPTGVLTAATALLLGGVSNVVVPRMVRTNERQYGTIGTVFAIESWFVVVAATIVLAAVAGAWLGQHPGRLGEAIRGPAGWERRPRRLLRPRRRSARSSVAAGNDR
jgi:membrane protein